MLNTSFLWLRARPVLQRRTIPRNTGLSLMLLWPLHVHSNAEIQAVCPTPIPAKGEVKIAEKREVATVNFKHGQGENNNSASKV